MINKYIPLYDLLTEHEKTLFSNSSEGVSFLAYLERYNRQLSPSIYDSPAFRIAYRKQRDENIRDYIVIKSNSRADFIQLKVQVIAKFFPGIEFTDDELNYLSSRSYSTSVLTYSVERFRETWIANFCADESLEATAIHRNIFNKYDSYFGFLFKKTQNLRELLATAHGLQFKSMGDTIKFLQQTMRNEWPNTASYTERLFAVVEGSLGYFLKYPANITQKYVNDIANAHTVYRFLGLSSENMVLGIGFEGVPRPYANLLDLYNYHQNRIVIAEGLGILQTLSIPFRLFFNEYVDIARVEENPLSICLRAFLPFLVMGVILSCAYTILLPFAAHVFLEYLLFIPTLYLSIAAAGAYIQYKNSAYTAMLEWWYGSLYMAPQFHSNQRIQSAFLNDEALSTQVAKYYANSLEECDRIEQLFATRQSEFGLKDEQLLERKINLKLKFDLYMEWYDLHDRQDLGVDRIPAIVLERIRSEHQRLRQKIKEHSEVWSQLLNSKQSFFERPDFREKFDRLKEFLFANESLESNIKDYINGLDGAEHQERRLNDLC